MVRPPHLPREFAVPINVIQGELTRLIDQYWPNNPLGPRTEGSQVDWVPAIDLFETGEEVVLLADLPGVEPSTVDLTIDGLVLTLGGEKRSGADEARAGAGPRPIRERRFGHFQRKVTLPAAVNVDAVEAALHNGVLTVRLPKAETAKVRTIPIQPA
jgi:HSP20 family protein